MNMATILYLGGLIKSMNQNPLNWVISVPFLLNHPVDYKHSPTALFNFTLCYRLTQQCLFLQVWWKIVSLVQTEVQRFTLILVSSFHLKQANRNRFIQTILASICVVWFVLCMTEFQKKSISFGGFHFISFKLLAFYLAGKYMYTLLHLS